MMSWARAASNMSPRRRRDFGDGLPEVHRTASNVSSNASSDILVAGPTQSTTPHHHGASSAASHSYKHFPPAPMEASINNGLLAIRFSNGVARDRFRGIIRTKPKPISQASNSIHQQTYKAAIDDDEDSSYGPNHRGTYSKEYTQLHPNIKWVHRGQGRYLPAAEIKSDNPNVSPRPTRQTTEKTTGSVAMSERTMDKMTEALEDHFDDFRRRHNPNAKPGWSPSFKHQFSLILNLIKTTPRHQWPKAIELIRDKSQREVVRKWNKAMDVDFPMNNTATAHNSAANDDGARTRLSRQAKTAIPSIEQRRSSRLTDAPANSFYAEDDDMAGDSDDSHDPDKTFRKEYVEAHPNETFHHTGNGWYKRGSRSESDKHSRRRDSTASHAVRKYSSSEVSRELDPGITIHADDLHNYPGMTFHHKGNRYYKPGVGPTGKRGSITVAVDGQVIRPDRRRSSNTQYEEDTESIKAVVETNTSEMPGTFSKEYTLLHPEIDWVHRGGGRYRRKSSTYDARTATPAASSERRSSRADNSFTKDYAESHISDDFRRSSGRRRSSKPKIDTWNDEPSELFDGAYVKAHPNEVFHHRGQGRWARGVRPPRPALSTQDSEDLEPEGLFDSTYVHEHPDETFHHRGQGKWARGLPPPGSSNKTAVRGPGAQDKMAFLRSEEDTGPKPPPLTALLRREDGPDKWPQLSWQYRGGGKWCQVSKDEATRLTSGGRKSRAVGSRARAGDGPEAQLQREALAAERKATALQKPARIIRKRSGLGEMKSKGSSNSQSKAPTPRPPLLPPEEDKVTEEDLPSLFKDDWSDTEADELDEAAKIMRRDFQPMIGPEAFLKALTKHDPAARSLDSLKLIAGNAQLALQQLQDEYLALDEIVAKNPMHGKKERKPVKGGRQPVETGVWEDKKESILYDYNFDPRKIGYQDPDAQRIVRDEEGRELRRRRNRYGHDPHATAVDYGDGEMTAKRTIKPVSRFDGVVVQPPRKRSRLNHNITNDTLLATPPEEKTPSATPDRGATPMAPEDYQAPSRGRWKNHVPKRVLQLRGDSVGSNRSGNGEGPSSSALPAVGGSSSPKPAGVRKGRPPGSKNLHKRKDAGIKKGPRKPKLTTSAPNSASASVEPEGTPPSFEMQQDGGDVMMRMGIPAIIESAPPVEEGDAEMH